MPARLPAVLASLAPVTAAAAPAERAVPAGDLAATAPLAQGLPAGYASEYLLGVTCVLLALGVMAWLARRMQGMGGAGRGSLRVESSLPLGGKERLLVVQVEGERLLLGVGAGGVRHLAHLAPRELPAAEHGPPDGWLARTLRREVS